MVKTNNEIKYFNVFKNLFLWLAHEIVLCLLFFQEMDPFNLAVCNNLLLKEHHDFSTLWGHLLSLYPWLQSKYFKFDSDWDYFLANRFTLWGHSAWGVRVEARREELGDTTVPFLHTPFLSREGTANSCFMILMQTGKKH